MVEAHPDLLTNLCRVYVACMTARYDTISVNYDELRKPDPRIVAAIDDALGPAHTVFNIGAGTGSYEPADRAVTKYGGIFRSAYFANLIESH